MPKSVYLIATVYTEKTNGADYIPSPAKKERTKERKHFKKRRETQSTHAFKRTISS